MPVIVRSCGRGRALFGVPLLPPVRRGSSSCTSSDRTYLTVPAIPFSSNVRHRHGLTPLFIVYLIWATSPIIMNG